MWVKHSLKFLHKTLSSEMEQTKVIKRKFAPVRAHNTSEPEEIRQFKWLVTNCPTRFDSSNEKEIFRSYRVQTGTGFCKMGNRNLVFGIKRRENEASYWIVSSTW